MRSFIKKCDTYVIFNICSDTKTYTDTSFSERSKNYPEKLNIIEHKHYYTILSLCALMNYVHRVNLENYFEKIFWKRSLNILYCLNVSYDLKKMYGFSLACNF